MNILNNSYAPQCFAVHRERFAVHHEWLGGASKSFGDAPERFRGFPETLGDTPEPFEGFPERLADAPKLFGEMSETHI